MRPLQRIAVSCDPTVKELCGISNYRVSHRTPSAFQTLMSEMGHQRKSARPTATSVFPSGTDIISQTGHVGFVPEAD
jgi:hypothetical protein